MEDKVTQIKQNIRAASRSVSTETAYKRGKRAGMRDAVTIINSTLAVSEANEKIDEDVTVNEEDTKPKDSPKPRTRRKSKPAEETSE